MLNTKEEKGILVMILLIMMTFIIKNYDKLIIQFDTDDSITYQTNRMPRNLRAIPLDSFLTKTNKSTPYKLKQLKKQRYCNKNNIASRKNSKIELFNFNPNTINRDSLLLLGISRKAASNWTKYLHKGGHFYTKKDILKVYGLNKTTYNTIEKFIVFASKKKYKTKHDITIAKANKQDYDKKYSIIKKKHSNIKIEINTCNAEELKLLKGIGDVLSKRIIKFRDKLGGFVSINQIKEVYVLPDETFKNIKGNIFINANKIKKLKINIEDGKSLKNFPYISYRLASQIIKFRKQHGFFKDKYDLLKIRSIDSLKLKKIEPYLDYAVN